MKRLLSIALLLPTLALLSGIVVGQEEKKDDRPAKKATAEDYKRLATMGSYYGKVSVTPKGVAFHIDDGDYRKDLKKAASLATAAEQKKMMAYVEQQYAKKKWALGKEFELELSEKVVMRKTKYEFEYDEKGNPKKIPPPDFANTYPAKVEDFGDYMTVVTFGKMKDGKPTVAKLVVHNDK